MGDPRCIYLTMNKYLILKAVLCIIFVLLLGACSLVQPTPIIKVVYVKVTPTSSSTPTPSATPTPTPTPTSTAMPISITGDIRTARISTPSPQYGAQCGIVDLLDFPLNPPDAVGTRGGGDYGVYRERFSGHHTGEDWGINGRSSFGEPVYSVGHGLVTYAHPNGWGEDKGTVIVQHSFSDGSVIYSFYGHLDPPSVELTAGQCVARGEKIGEIGRPRTPPHLHFEIRSVFPNQPARGYLPYDPTIAGWKPPSTFILEQRLKTSPGVQWMRASPDLYVRFIGAINENAILLEEEDHLVAIDISDGSILWSEPTLISARDIALDFSQALIYVINYAGDLTAFSLPETTDSTIRSSSILRSQWTIELETNGRHQLIPLPGGGIVVSTGQDLVAYSSDGGELWIEESFGGVSWWGVSEEQVLLSPDVEGQSIWEITETGEIQNLAQLSGQALLLDPQFMIYNKEGLYLLEPETNSLQLIYSLPKAFPDLGRMLKLPDGGVLIAHSDFFDRRLIALHPDGSLRWERSYAQDGAGQLQLFMLDAGPMLIMQKTSARFGVISILSVDVAKAELTPIFEGGPIGTFPVKTWAQVVDGTRLLVNLGGNWMVMIDTQVALEAVRNPEEIK